MRSWVRRAGASLRTATPYGIVALLAASATAPIAGVAMGTTAGLTAVLAQLGGVGSNYLAEALLATARRLRGTDPTEDQWREAIAEELLARLEAGDEQAEALRDEVAALLHAVGAVDVALREADEHGREALAAAFGALSEDVGRLSLLATDAAHVLATMQQQLAEQGRTQRQHTDLLRQSLVITAQLHQEVLGRRPERTSAARERPDPDAANPYPGLASFQAVDARYFHGRETLVAELLGRLAEQLVGGPPVVVIGVSGVGKSSLLRAGVLPAIANGGLAEDSASWPWLVMTPGATPLAELTSRTATLAAAGPTDADPAGDSAVTEQAAAGLAAADPAAFGALADPAAAGPVDVDPAAFGELAARAGGAGRLVIVVDQFEELFTQCPDPAERAAFVEALAAAAPALVLIAVRADFYPQCTELAAMVPMLAAGPILVGPLGTDELRRAVREPAADAGLQLEPGLEELLLTDLGALSSPAGYEPGALPLLAHACAQPGPIGKAPP
ncbi:MAG TPA: AAA family ATPase [Actinoplanes sp.]|nr:AAA family ATPase [Actinoplanes sp.]